MSEEIQKTNSAVTGSDVRKNESLKLQIANAIAKGEISTADDIANTFGLTFEQSMMVLSDSQFMSIVAKFTKSRAQLAFSTEGINRLIGMMGNEDAKVRLSSIKMLAEVAGVKQVSKGTDVNVNLNLENLVKGAESKTVEKTVFEQSRDESIDIDFEKL